MMVRMVMFAGVCLLGCKPQDRSPVARPMPVLRVDAPSGPVGFDARVELRARVEPADDRARWVIGFEHLWGPSLRDATRRDNVLRYRTPLPPPPTGKRGIVELSAATAGRQVFRVTARTAGRQLRTTIQVYSALPTAGWPRMALGVEYYLPGQWQVQRGALSIRSSAHRPLTVARPTAPGEYHLRSASEPERTLIVRGGQWLGYRDCGRVDCHPVEHLGWLTTAHASVFTRGIRGEQLRTHGPYRERCLPCHTLGYQPGADNDGFDDRQRRSNWRFPSSLDPSAWRRLPQELRERANVQCESCHGPAWFYTGYGIDICAQCHDYPPRYPKVRQLRDNRMLRAERSIDGLDEQKNCRLCHRASGFLQSIRGHRSTSRPDLDLDMTPRGVTCATCHDPHDRGCARQLRLCGEVEVPGLTFDAGQGALCISCHNGESDVARGQLVRPFVPGKPRNAAMAGHGRASGGAAKPPLAAPHAPQFQVVTSRGGKFLELPRHPTPARPNPHMFVPNTCVGCHYDRSLASEHSGGHTFRLAEGRDSGPLCSTRLLELNRIKRSTHTRPCQDCHGARETLNVTAKGDYDGDGELEGIVDEVEGLLRTLVSQIGQYAGHAGSTLMVLNETLTLADDRCQPLQATRPLEPGSPLYKAAYNLMLVLRDGSGGIHDPWYTVRLLQQTIVGLDRLLGSRAPRRWLRR